MLNQQIVSSEWVKKVTLMWKPILAGLDLSSWNVLLSSTVMHIDICPTMTYKVQIPPEYQQ